jgi:hypothetical protein
MQGFDNKGVIPFLVRQHTISDPVAFCTCIADVPFLEYS